MKESGIDSLGMHLEVVEPDVSASDPSREIGTQS